MYVNVAVVLLVCGRACVYAQTPCFNDSVRLQGLGVKSAGHVEICIDGVWGTVCSLTDNSQWSLKNTQVVCQQLGYVTAVNSLPQSSLTFGVRAGDLVPIHLSEVHCNGTEPWLRNCSHSRIHSCSSHFTDAAVVCGAEEAREGDVRLRGDVADYRGAVEYYDSILGWTGVCADSAHSDSWTSNSAAARIVCTQLGYEGGRPFIQSIESLGLLGVADLDCSSGSFSLSDCSHQSVVLTGGCETQEAGWVECREIDEEDYTLRLVGGSREGVLEVALNGRWGTVCEDEFWDSGNAEVACTELGLTSQTGYTISPSTSYDQYMSRLKPFWLSNVNCLTGDNTIEDCDRSTIIGFSSCSSATANSVFNSAEINCGEPIPFMLTGGHIAGIVIGVLVVVGAAILAFIYLPERWKRRHTYPLWVKLTTPSRWCENVSMPRMFRRQRRTAAVTTPSSETAEYPPATHRSSLEREEPAAETSSASEEEQERSNAGLTNLFPSPQAPPPPSEPQPQGDLTTAAPPPYQAAVSYPTASRASKATQPFEHPPAYTEKGSSLPDPSAAYPPPAPSIPPGAGPSTGVLPYPTAVSLDPAYPPPLQPPYPS